MTNSTEIVLADRLAEPDEVVRIATLVNDIEDRLLPRPPTLLSRLGGPLRVAGALSLGWLAASVSMFLIYIFLTLLFQFQP